MLQELEAYKDIIKKIERSVYQDGSYSYSLGFNLKNGSILQAKLYIRLFARRDDLSLFIDAFSDLDVKSLALAQYNSWDSSAFRKKGVGFKGFTLLVGWDYTKDDYFYGFGGKVKNGNFQAITFSKEGRDLIHNKRVYEYEKKEDNKFLSSFKKKCKFYTEFLEFQYKAGEKEPSKFCFCPEFSKDNINELSNNISLNLPKKYQLINYTICNFNEGMKLVNIGFDKEGGIKLYHHNFLTQNKIESYL